MSAGKTFPVPDLVHRRAVSEGAQGLAWLVPSLMMLVVAFVVDRALGKPSEALA